MRLLNRSDYVSAVYEMTNAEPYIDKELEPVIGIIPEQAPWDLERLRAEGERQFGGATPLPRGTHLTETKCPKCPLRVISWTESPITGDTPIIVSIHGGGFISGAAKYDDARNARLARDLECVVVSPDYHLVPECSFARQVEDCAETLQWVCNQFPGHPVFVFGDSAGATLGLTALVQHLEAGRPQSNGLILFEPGLDPTFCSRSFETYADGPVWTRAAAQASWQLCGSESADIIPDIRRIAALPSFPPVQVVVNAVDPLRDEGIQLATDLIDAGLQAELQLWAGTFHASLGVVGSQVWQRVRYCFTQFVRSHS